MEDARMLNHDPTAAQVFPERVAFTIVTRNHFHYAAALSESLTVADPQLCFVVIVADLSHVGTEDRTRLDWMKSTHRQVWHPCRRKFHNQRMLLGGEEVCDFGFSQLAFQYTAFELTCALKSQAGCFFWKQGVSELLYLDADVRLFQSADVVFDELCEGGFLLTPHVRSRLPEDGKYPNNIDLLRTGNFNAGIWAYRRHDQLEQVLNWWRDCCRYQCIVDPHDGLFVDQKWLDQAVSISEATRVSRNTGLNVGYWNLHEFDLQKQFEKLVAFHFSGTQTGIARLSKHQNRHPLRPGTKLEAIVAEYCDGLARHHHTYYSEHAYLFQTLRDGTDIKSQWREVVRSNTDNLRESDENPFEFFANDIGHQRLDNLSEKLLSGRFDWQQMQLHHRIEKLRKKLDRQPLRWLANTIKRRIRRV